MKIRNEIVRSKRTASWTYLALPSPYLSGHACIGVFITRTLRSILLLRNHFVVLLLAARDGLWSRRLQGLH